MLYWKNTVARQQIILIPRCRGYKLCILPVPRILYNRIIVRDYYNRVRFVRSFATHTGSFKISCVSCPTHSFTRFSKHDIVSQVESTLATACGVESNCIVTKANGSKGKVIKHDFQISFQMSQSLSVPVGDL